MNLRSYTGFISAALFISSAAFAAGNQTKASKQDLLVKLAAGINEISIQGATVEKVTDGWVRVQSNKRLDLNALQSNGAVEYVQPNYKISLLENYQIKDNLKRAALMRSVARSGYTPMALPDNPAIPNAPTVSPGNDPLLSSQWGMNDIGGPAAWKISMGSPDMIVAVIDTGVDYTHEDLVQNMWRNSKEIPANGIDDDNNGYIDDIVGWDFSSNDNKPFDLAMDPIDVLFKGGNPGHGTHCAGNVAAKGNNGKGVSGVAPNVKIMALRFISEKGSGTSADAIKAIRYAVDNGAKVLSNSWGSEGEDPAEDTENKALREAIQYAQDKGTLFIAAAGNGHKGVGYSNDTDALPSYPATYPFENIISVAALDANNALGSFSNWGEKTVHIGAPGVKVFSTTVGSNYSDIVVDKYGIKATWDGTSMATPHVAGAAALYWSMHPEQDWRQVKAALLNSVEKIPALAGKTTTGGKLSLKNLIK